MANLTTALATEFTPTADKFSVEVNNGTASILRKSAGGSLFQSIGDVSNMGVIVDNVVGCVYKIQPVAGSPTVVAAE